MFKAALIRSSKIPPPTIWRHWKLPHKIDCLEISLVTYKVWKIFTFYHKVFLALFKVTLINFLYNFSRHTVSYTNLEISCLFCTQYRYIKYTITRFDPWDKMECFYRLDTIWEFLEIYSHSNGPWFKSRVELLVCHQFFKFSWND